MRNASVLRKPSIGGSRATTTTPQTTPLLVVVLLALFGLCCDVTFADDGYSIPADAIRIQTKELTATRLTQHLAGLMGNDSSANSLDRRPIHDRVNGKDFEDDEERELEEQEERVSQADNHHLPTALARLNALLRAAEERKERFESNAATSRLLSINRGGFFRGCKLYHFAIFSRLLYLHRLCISRPLRHYQFQHFRTHVKISASS